MIKLNIKRFSGGSFDYKYLTLDDYYSGCMYDDELNEMINDLVKVLHDLEWWQSCDMSEEEYRTTVDEFKNKWLRNKETTQQIKLNVIKRYLEDGIKILKGEENE